MAWRKNRIEVAALRTTIRQALRELKKIKLAGPELHHGSGPPDPASLGERRTLQQEIKRIDTTQVRTEQTALVNEFSEVDAGLVEPADPAHGGAAAELNAALEVAATGPSGDVAIPWALLSGPEPEIRQGENGQREQRAFTDTGGYGGGIMQRPILQRLFGLDLMAALDVRNTPLAICTTCLSILRLSPSGGNPMVIRPGSTYEASPTGRLSPCCRELYWSPFSSPWGLPLRNLHNPILRESPSSLHLKRNGAAQCVRLWMRT